MIKIPTSAVCLLLAATATDNPANAGTEIRIAAACVKAITARHKPTPNNQQSARSLRRYKNKVRWCRCVAKGINLDRRVPKKAKIAIPDFYRLLATDEKNWTKSEKLRAKKIEKDVGWVGLGAVARHQHQCDKKFSPR